MNISKILDKHNQSYNAGGLVDVREAEEAMIEAVRQALELAAERAEVDDTPDGSDVGHTVNKQSILSVMKDIKQSD